MSEPNIEFENERIRVLRVRVGPGETHRPPSRNDRVVIWLTDAEHVRSEAGGSQERMARQAGDVMWRGASEHQIENTGGTHEVLIVELKEPRC